MTKAYWLIAYYQGSGFHECAYHGTLGQWRIEMMEHSDGPYILVGAHKLSKAEFGKLDGYIG